MTQYLQQDLRGGIHHVEGIFYYTSNDVKAKTLIAPCLAGAVLKKLLSFINGRCEMNDILHCWNSYRVFKKLLTVVLTLTYRFFFHSNVPYVCRSVRPSRCAVCGTY